ncbi:MAG: hypothetical protein AB8C84_12080 [Oligoflexales bacterium]
MFFLTTNTIYSAPLLVDRLILEINGESYTQKEMELTLMLLAIFKDRQPIPLQEASWGAALLEYREFMKSFHESLKKGRIYPREDLVAQKTSEVYVVARKNPILQRQLERLDVNSQTLSVGIAMVLQTKTWESFPAQRKNDSKEQTSIIRWYENAQTYKKIHPRPSTGT